MGTLSKRVENGYIWAQGRTWPLYERRVFTVEAVGYLDFSDHHISEQGLKASMESSLREILDPWGVKVSVEPRMLVEMSPEDRAEKESLEEKAVSNYLAGA